MLVVKGNVGVEARHYGTGAELLLDGSTDVSGLRGSNNTGP